MHKWFFHLIHFIYLFVFVSKRPTLSKTLYHLVLVHVDLLHSFLFAENISLFFVNLTKTEQEQKNRNLHAHCWHGQGGHGGGHSGTLHALNTMWTWSPNTSSSMSILELSTNLREVSQCLEKAPTRHLSLEGGIREKIWHHFPALFTKGNKN